MTTGRAAGPLWRRPVWIGATAAVLLGAGSTAQAAATGGWHGPATASCQVSELTGSVVRVTLTDMGGMMMSSRHSTGHMAISDTPQTVPAGTVSLQAINNGRLVHEVLILPLPAGQIVGHRTVGADGRVDESTSLGESSASCAQGPGDGITPHATGWVTLNLAPGRYELLCNIPGHYTAGAYAELDAS